MGDVFLASQEDVPDAGHSDDVSEASSGTNWMPNPTEKNDASHADEVDNADATLIVRDVVASSAVWSSCTLRCAW